MQGLANKSPDFRQGNGAFLQRLEGTLKHFLGNLACAATAGSDDDFLWFGILDIGVHGDSTFRANHDFLDLFWPFDISLAKEKACPKLFKADGKNHGGAYGLIVKGDAVGGFDGQALLLLADSLGRYDCGFLGQGELGAQWLFTVHRFASVSDLVFRGILSRGGVTPLAHTAGRWQPSA